MLRTIALFAAFFWMAVFAMLAIASADGAAPSALLVAGDRTPPLAGAATPVLTAAFTLGFAVVAALFLWSFVTVLFESAADESDSVVRAAFGSAAGMLAILLLTGAAAPVAGAIPALSVELAALMATYAAIHAEKRAVAAAADRNAIDDVSIAARLMAQGAAHRTLLTRLSGRPGSTAKEGGSR